MDVDSVFTDRRYAWAVPGQSPILGIDTVVYAHRAGYLFGLAWMVVGRIREMPLFRPRSIISHIGLQNINLSLGAFLGPGH